MRILTYLVAAALLWAVASSGPATSSSTSEAPPTPRTNEAQRGHLAAPVQGNAPSVRAHSR